MATTKQEIAVARMAENGGNVSAAMRDAGYSAVSSRTPKKLTSSKGYAKLLEKYLPDALLLEKHHEIIMSPRLKRTFMKGAMIEETEETDPSQVRALDMAYKLKGKYANDGVTNNVLIVQLNGTAADRYKLTKQS
jgi:hypothetical protein